MKPSSSLLTIFLNTLMLLTASAIALPAAAQSSTDSDTPEKIQQVENNLAGPVQIEGEKPWNILERMHHYQVKGISIAIVHQYKIAWVKGYGWADESLKNPVTTQTLFQAASISKSLNGVGILKLVQDKKLDLYKDINQYLVTWKFPYDSLSKGKKISVANLLSHTGGLTVHGFPGYEKGTAIPTVVQILEGHKPANSPAIKSMYEPGLRSEYSGGGITVSQLILTDITKQPYAQFMDEQVLKPMGMTRSTYAQPPVAINPLWLATGYDRSGNEIPGKYHVYPEQAAAGLWTNPTDLAKYIIETQLSLEGKSAKILTQEMTKLRLTPYADEKAALGVFIDNFNGTRYFEHSGSNEGFMSQYYGSMEGGEGMVIMVNSDNGAIIREIVNSIAKVYQFKGLFQSKSRVKVDVDSSVLKTYPGKYALSDKFVIEITREGNNLFAQATNQPKFQLFAESPVKFFLTIVDAEIAFIKDENGPVTKIVLYQNGTSTEGKKTSPLQK